MEVNLILSISVYVVLSRAMLAEGRSFNVSVPENATVGTEVVGMRQWLGNQKAELPCVKTEGDPYGRFLLTKACTLVVANPLDWSVQSEYTIKIRVGGGREVRSVSIQVTDVPGYPPVYNETCETPVNPRGKDTGEFLFRADFSMEAETDTGDVFAVRTTFSKPLEKWDSLTPFFEAETSNCQFYQIRFVRNLNDLVAAEQLWFGNARNLSCLADDNAKLFINLFDEESVDENLNFMYMTTLIFPTKSTVRFVCQVPPFGEPFRIGTPPNPTKLVHVQSLNIAVHPQGCPVAKYGVLCLKNCTCKNGASCHGFNGACKCQHGWQGVACDIPKPGIAATATPSDSAAIYISINVTIHCHVYHIDVETLSLRFPNASEIITKGVNQLDINVINAQLQDEGLYTCQARDKDGKVFNTTIVLNINCLLNRKGELCDEVCDCLQGASCDRWAGCVCPPGWNGTRCQTQCPEGTYGKDCNKTCDCQNGASCSPDDGRCNCTAGWYGSNCDGACPKSRYGWRCRQVCSCKNNATCHHVDGSCACVPPWGGRNCDKLHVTHTPSLVEILVPLGFVLLVVTVVLIVLYKTGRIMKHDEHEVEVLRELRRVEEDLAQRLQPGWLRRWEKKISHLTPGDLIGEGMFGRVIQAQLRTPEEDITVAAKTVRSEDPQTYRDFYREAAILVVVHEEKDHDVRNSNIVQLLGMITTSKEKYILLEYSPTGDLLWVLRQFREDDEDDQADLLDRFLRYAVHVARALGELERLRIVHRDVATRNVLITVDDVAKLADFGLARDVHVYTTADDASTSDDECHRLIPLKWMALESIETGKYTCQSDVWSFGVLLWEIATLGKDPCYNGRFQLSFLQMLGILRQGIRMERPPGCPEDLYRLMRLCWREVPATRPTPDGIEKRLLQLLPYDAIEMETAL
ncbi:melanoma receptor tyrosine-protein kinase-like [Branchiostoma floridae]|uniref:Melanoma receptor tyrosine-protein kinase-like n=1 Tax=Branchiostoma floridae TaxID=7739 RepID=A0A9J7LRM2_BRAFL|nr:melanoma receptor tyrosine-protein kinase-like [Branchiostoma floridae]